MSSDNPILRAITMLQDYKGDLARRDFPDNDEGDHLQRVNENKRASVDAAIRALRDQPNYDTILDALRHQGLSIDGDNAYKRDLLDSVVGAMAFGYQNTNQPPAGHWGQQFWDIGRAEGEKQDNNDTIRRISELFSIGANVRTQSAIMANVENTHKFARMLHAIESEFFMVAGEIDPDYPDDQPYDCLVNCWGSSVEQYVEQFRKALKVVALSTTAPCDHQWIDDGQFLLVCTSCGAQEDHDPKWCDMATAPRDGTMVRLLVEFTEHATDDADQAPTIGANNFENDGEDRWQFAGWCWSHDHFTEGKGEPIGWLPMLDEPRCIASEQLEQQP